MKRLIVNTDGFGFTYGSAGNPGTTPRFHPIAAEPIPHLSRLCQPGLPLTVPETAICCAGPAREQSPGERPAAANALSVVPTRDRGIEDNHASPPPPTPPHPGAVADTRHRPPTRIKSLITYSQDVT